MMDKSALLLLAFASSAIGAEAASVPDVSDEVIVSARHGSSSARSDRTRRYERKDFERFGALTASALVKALPRGSAGMATTVLINGRESLRDLETLPIGLIERVEINFDGGMPDGRPRVAEQVINVVLKSDYQGGDLSVRQRNTFEGGGGQREAVASAGYAHGRLSISVMATHLSQNALAATQREISRDQDHTATGGRDFRLPWGTSAVVQAVQGNLNGVYDELGRPASIALAPDFTAAPGGASAEGLRHFNTASFLHLLAPSQTTSTGLTLGFHLTERTRLEIGYQFASSKDRQISPPPVTGISSGAIVPAALNPFGQDIAVGFVHEDFGPQEQDSSSDSHAASLMAESRFGESWSWNAQLSINRSRLDSRSRELDAERFASALASWDPLARFDPFGETSALYPSLTRTLHTASTIRSVSVGASANGQISEGWVDPLRLYVDLKHDVNESRQGELADRIRSLRSNGSLQIPLFRLKETNPPAVLSLTGNWSDDDQNSAEGAAQTQVRTIARSGSLQIPWLTPIDQWHGAYRLETEFGLGRASASGEERSQTRNLSVLWAPAKHLLVRARHSHYQVPPPNILFPVLTVYDQAFTDPSRKAAAATDVEVFTGTPLGLEPSFNRSQTFWIEVEPPAMTGLTLALSYSMHTQRNPLRHFSGQDILDNEAALPQRVTRAARTSADIAAGQPGAVIRVDTTPFAGGDIHSSSIDFSAQFEREQTRLGALHLDVSATRVLEFSNELLPDLPVISSRDQDSPPAWRVRGNAFLSRESWHAGLDLSHAGPGHYANAGYSDFTTVGVRVGYRIARGLHLEGGIQNLLNASPPRVDTLTGFRGEPPLGRTYELTFRVPVGSE
jgi:iron complex outermembrane recepter protein